jgi:hypothetical protein
LFLLPEYQLNKGGEVPSPDLPFVVAGELFPDNALVTGRIQLHGGGFFVIFAPK